MVALLNSPQGIYADAVLHRVSDIHDLFSSALANFHVTTRLYYQTCVFLFSLMPRRPFGHHYSTIGFNHVGKVAILNEITEQVRRGHRLQRSPGIPGTVALGFTFDECAYHLKVIRDQPTSSYKWGAFPGVAKVCDKYRVVHKSSGRQHVGQRHVLQPAAGSRIFDPNCWMNCAAKQWAAYNWTGTASTCAP